AIYDAGLSQKSQKSGRTFDRFRSQIIFPLADSRGRVRGFAGRTMGGPDDRRPKYVNSPESDLFHKRSQLFAADLARGGSAKAGFVVAAEGYTDVIAMYQVGLRNCVAIMGTALTENQIGELARLAPEVRLALDADSAGKDAMLRSARIALARRPPLRLRVVALPPGEDPADLVRRTGADEIQRLVSESVSFVRFRVLRTLETGDLTNAEGRDRVSNELTDVFSLLGPSAEREELRRIAADRLDLSPELLARVLPQGGTNLQLPTRMTGTRAADRASSAAPRPDDAASGGAILGRREPTERSFLAFCIALPELGAPALAELDLEADLTSAVTRRAAAHLRDHLAAPTAGLADDDPLLGFMRELAVGDARATAATAAAFEIERLQLTLARLEREIAAARIAARGDISELARRKSAAQGRLALAVERAIDEGGSG
ncbi:MAG: primase, partial [Solirubrobacteraceae bacterium]|nr:primase [Solirubrobacteraceae bacterium]